MIGLVGHWLAAHWLVALPAAFVLLALSPLGAALLATRRGVALLVVLVALAALQWYGAQRFADGAASVRDAANAHALAADLQVSEANREAEAARQSVFHSIEVAHARGVEEGAQRHAAVAAAVQRGDYVLRHELRCPAAARGPAAPAAEAGDLRDAAAAPGLLPVDVVSDLVRAAGDADRLLERARTCEAFLDADRAAVSP